MSFSHQQSQTEIEVTVQRRTLTVASLGVRAQLVPLDGRDEAQITQIVVAYEELCARWEALVRETLSAFGEGIRTCGVEPPRTCLLCGGKRASAERKRRGWLRRK